MPSLIKSWQSCSVVGRNVQTLNMLNRDIIDYTRQRQAKGHPPSWRCVTLELTQELLVNLGCEVKNPGFPWVLLTPSWLPGSIQDVVWRYGWSVLPTVDRMYKWHYVRSEQCVHCGMYEDNEHALLACRVAKTFWSLVDRAYNLLGVDRFVKSKRCPNGTLARLVLTAGMYVLWENRCLAVHQAKARKNHWPLLVRLYNTVTDHLDSEFFSLGEEECLKRWSCAVH
ncbi:hypothetical protein MRX96_005712 [Rhipicephalus microplus]